MNHPHPLPAGLTRRHTLLAFLGAASLSACGGGDGGDSSVAGVAVGGTGSFSVGPISGLGSIIVNGIRYDDSSANISSDDSPFPRSQFQLGMVVAVLGTPAVNGRSTATRILLGAELVGPIASIGTDSFVVLGQTVEVSSSTFFGPLLGNLAALRVNDVVEVHGVANAAGNSLRASYIGRRASPSEYKLQGIVTAHDATAKTFRIGTLDLDYSTTDADNVRVTPVVGALVRVRVLAGPASTAVWTVERIRRPEDSFRSISGEVEFKGTITVFTSLSSFSVNDIPVIATPSAFTEGTAGIAAGALVEVKGTLVNGVLQATRVEREDAVGVSEFELHGTVSSITVVSGGGSFQLTSSGGVTVTVDWTATVGLFRDGTEAQLIVGRRVEVKGLVATGNRISATRISFES